MESPLIWHTYAPLLLERDVINISGLQGVQSSQHTSSGTVVMTVQREGGTHYSYKQAC